MSHPIYRLGSDTKIGMRMRSVVERAFRVVLDLRFNICSYSSFPNSIILQRHIPHQPELGINFSYIGGRFDVSSEVLKTPYGVWDEHAKVEIQRQELEHAQRNYSTYRGQ